MQANIIDNLSSANNHFTRLKELFGESDTVILVSPFLMKDLSLFLEQIDLAKLRKLHVITTLCPNDADQIKKIASLKSLVDYPVIRNKIIDCQISLNNKLHGKVYVFKKDGNCIAAIISSANFTDKGLSMNHEWGIEITDNKSIDGLVDSILQAVEFPCLNFEEIDLMYQRTADFIAQQPEAKKVIIDLNLVESLSLQDRSEQFDKTIRFWLKPIGTSLNPVPEDRLFDQHKDYLHFSKQRPSGVKPNDIVVAYGVGTTKILSVYKVTSGPIRVSQQEIDDNKDSWKQRWPWYVAAENLTRNFGGSWSEHSLYNSNLLQEYLKSNPEGLITAVGGKTLGGLNHGKDKLGLNRDFARFIIDKITAIDQRL